MQIPVLIEPVASNGYRVTTGQPLALTAEGATREEALRHLRAAWQSRMSAGAEVTPLELSAPEHPLAHLRRNVQGQPSLRCLARGHRPVPQAG